MRSTNPVYPNWREKDSLHLNHGRSCNLPLVTVGPLEQQFAVHYKGGWLGTDIVTKGQLSRCDFGNHLRGHRPGNPSGWALRIRGLDLTLAYGTFTSFD